jgi:hypothetical protein
MSTLDDLTDNMEDTLLDELGDPIVYTASGGSAVATHAWVEFNTADIGTSGSAARTDAISIEIPMTVAATIAAEDRITIGRLSGKIYAPVGRPERGPMGNTWRFPLKRVLA